MSNKKNKISLEIEQMVLQDKSLTYLEACMRCAENYDIDISNMPKFISDALKMKIQREAQRKNLLKGSPSNTIPLDEINN